jgi:aminomethyltransferase
MMTESSSHFFAAESVPSCASPAPQAETVAQAGQQTALYENHRTRGAKLVDFAGWQLPLQFTRVMQEHQAVRQAAGLFDISHMGLVVVRSGDEAVTRAFLEHLFPRSLAKLVPGKAIYTQFLNEQGGIIDDVIVYCMPESEHLSGFQEFLIIANAANTQKDIAWLRQQAERLQVRGLQVEALAARYSLIALQGPRFEDILARTGYETDYLPERFCIREALIEGTPLWISRTGYTGEDGVELIVPSIQVGALWDLLLEVGRPHGLQPVGLAARDTLRLEAAYPLHGNDISEADTPLEAGLQWSLSLNKPVDFIGKTALLAQKEAGLLREFCCFTVNQRAISRHGDVILKEGEPIGVVTSGSISPLFNVPIGMGYVRSGAITGPGDAIQIRIRDTDVAAEIVERPFYQT